MAGGPANLQEFLDLVRKSGVVEEKRLDAHVQKLSAAGLLPPEPSKVAGVLIRDGFLTHFQADNILQGKWRRFTIGKYKVLERIGSGGMGQVYLCEHKLMRRRVAVKVLPTAKAADESALERFYREARAVAALDHPNIVHAYDIDQDENLHFLVMEYVDGANLQEMVKKNGPMDLLRACHYIRQSALGLQHAHEANLVHRDIKPGNILVDRTGVVKILDMGLARFFNDEDDILTKKFDENVLGTADYLAPEQALDSHSVDIRADIYSLGATFFFMLTGKTPFGEGTIAQKLIWHQTRLPKPLKEFRSDIPQAIQDILNKMMAKEADWRYTVPTEVADALEPFTQTPITPPPESEMPHLSLAASGAGPLDSGSYTGVSRTPTSAHRLNKPITSLPPRPSSAPPRSNPSEKSTPNPLPALVAAVKSPSTPLLKSDSQVTKQQLETLPTPLVGEEEKVPWENFGSDTQEHAAKDDTAPRSVHLTRQSKGEELAKRKEKRRLWGVVIALSLFLFAVVNVLLIKYVFNQPVDPKTIHEPLTVSQDGSKRFKTIRLALSAAQAGDVIEIFDAVHEENLVVDQRGAEVTLQAAPGVKVHWVSAKKDEKTPLIHIAKAPGFRIKGNGITLDGLIEANRKVENVIFITLSSPGLLVEDLQFVNIGHNAVKVMNAQGTKENTIRLLNLSCPETPDQKNIVGFDFDANSNTLPPFNDFIEINQFKGVPIPFQSKDNTVLGSNIKRLH